MAGMQTKFRFNKTSIDQIPTPEKRLRLRDAGVEGLVLEMAPSGSRTFRVYKKIKGQTSPVTVTLGKYPGMSIENARKQAIEALNRISGGINPNEAERAKRQGDMTLRQVYEDYTALKNLTDSTRTGYKRIIETYLKAYQNKPLNRLTEEVVKKEHRRITEASPAQADLVMRFLRALFNFARYEYRGLNNAFLFEHNPVQILSHQKLWNKVARKHTRLTKGQLPTWFDGLETVRQQGDLFAVSVCDMAKMALLTGLRRNELLSLTWHHVNLKERTYYLSTTKNGDPLELPISDYLYQLLKRRHSLRDDSVFVFNAPNQYGQIKEPKKVLAKIVEQSGISFTLHDLRRTFTTTAEAVNVGGYSIKRLLNHRTRRDDVTAGYMVLTPEELREPAQKIENAILTQAGIKMPEQGLDKTLTDLLSGLNEKEKRELVFALSDKKQKEAVNDG
jgi:integrase